MKSAKCRGFDPVSKKLYDLQVLASRPLLPSRVEKMCRDLQDYDYVGMTINSVPGLVRASKSGEVVTFTPTGSKQAFDVAPSKLLGDVRFVVKKLTLSGKVTESKGAVLPVLEVTEAKEVSK